MRPAFTSPPAARSSSTPTCRSTSHRTSTTTPAPGSPASAPEAPRCQTDRTPPDPAAAQTSTLARARTCPPAGRTPR
jgi:hypothetical protein